MPKHPLRALLGAFLILLVITLSSCSDNGQESHALAQFRDTYNKNDTWLIHWYLCASDLETTSAAATNDLEKLASLNLPDNVKVLIQAGGTREWQNDLLEGDQVFRLLYEGDEFRILEKVPNTDMGSMKGLADFLRFGKENFQADHHVFIFWNHGGGSTSGVCFDDTTGNYLSPNDIRQAFEMNFAPSAENPPFELIGFDACLMANYDTANSLLGLTRYMTASEEIVPWHGWNYTEWVGTLADNPAIGGAKLGKSICDSYMELCRQEDTADTATLSVVDMTRLPALTTAYDAFGTEALARAAENPKKFFSAYSRQAKQAENYGGNTHEQGYFDMVDLADLAYGTQDILPNSSPAVIKAVEDAIIYKVCGDYRNQGGGLSVFYSYDNDVDDFNQYAKQKAASLPNKYLSYYLVYGELLDGAKELLNGRPAPQTLPAPPDSSKKDLFQIISLEDTPVHIDPDGYAVVQLNADQMDIVSEIRCHLTYTDPEKNVRVYLGSDTDLIVDWANGLIKDNFQGNWPMLDGHPLYLEILTSDENYNLYSSPIKLNGEKCNLLFAYSFEDNAFHVLGARKESDENGFADRNYMNLKEGDKITTIRYVLDLSGKDDDFLPMDAETFTVGKDSILTDGRLKDGSYGYLFEFIAPNDASAMSRLVNFTMEGENITTFADE